MRKVLGCLLGICLAVSAQAVTVKWTIPTGDYTSDLGGIYFVYSTTQVTDYDALYTGTKDLASGGTSGTYTRFDGDFLSPNMALGGLESLTASTTGYYYLLVFSSTDKSLYAVGGDKQYVSGGSKGIYEPTVDGVKPETGDYVDMGGFIGGNWSAATVPEPTLLSLLAFGVAGLALRRKSHC